jgi:hypothetical protein
MIVPLRIKFVAQYFKCWILQISLLLFIQTVKITKLSHIFTIKDVLNKFINHDRLKIDHKINDGNLKYTHQDNILYYLKEPLKNNYHNNIILFIGGRNSIIPNIDFANRLSNHLSIPVATFQYSGLYKSGYDEDLSYSSYMKSIDVVYNLLSSKYNVHLVAYSLGCYGSYCINKKNSIFNITILFFRILYSIYSTNKII